MNYGVAQKSWRRPNVMATPSAMIVWPLSTPWVPSTDAVALATQTADGNRPNCCGHPPLYHGPSLRGGRGASPTSKAKMPALRFP
jgi:hypothetical protein